jgi:predicted metal-dependent hydrolase
MIEQTNDRTASDSTREAAMDTSTSSTKATNSPVKSLAPEHRRTRFTFANIPRHWNGGDPLATRILDALSINFPEGERFFIESILPFESKVQSEELRQAIRVFAKQEGQHAASHSLYNKVLASQGVDVERVRRMLAAQKRYSNRLSPRMQLALTAASEHLTAIMAEDFMEDDSLLRRGANPAMRGLFQWHAVEEIEHRSVAYDVYQGAAGGGYFLRAYALLIMTLYLHVQVTLVVRQMFAVDAVPNAGEMVKRGLLRLYGRHGAVTRLLPRYFAWFRPGFHPNDTEVPPRIAAWIKEYQKHQSPAQASEDVRDTTTSTATTPRRQGEP